MVKQAFTLLAALAVAEDETTMLSLRAESASAARHLQALSEVGSNVTQMQLLVRDMVEEVDCDQAADKSTCTALKELLTVLEDIKNNLRKEHNDDQTELDKLNKCFDDAKADFHREKEENKRLAEMAFEAKTILTQCRSGNKELYVDWINKCEALDDFIAGLDWPESCDQQCIWDERDTIAGCLDAGKTWYVSKYEAWSTLHTECVQAGIAYRHHDQECDSHQSTFEVDTCTVRQAEWTTCNDHFMSSCDACSIKFDELVNEIECREKDRKVDHSAAEKIRCYIDVLLTAPSDEELKAVCKDGKDECITSWRIEEYKKCEKVCEEVDFEAGVYQVIEGVNGTHRTTNKDAEKRCTRELDIDFPAKDGCDACPPLPPYPCDTQFVSESYEEYLSEEWVGGIDKDTKQCSGFMHQEWSAYSMAECRPCPELIGRNPQKRDATCQIFGDEIVIESSGQPDAYINLAEVIVNGGSNNDHWNKPFLSGVYPGGDAVKCIDGNADTICHTLTTTGNFRLKSDASMCIDDITILNRASFQSRITGATISVLNKGVKVWQDGFKSTQPHYAWAFQGKEDIIHRNVCLGPRDSHHATLPVPPGTCLSGAEITHRSGYVSCREAAHGNSNFGCDDNSIAIVFTQKGSQQVIMPTQDTIGYQFRNHHAHWYGMDGVSKNSQLLPLHQKHPIIANGDLDMWYGEDLVHYTEDDNHGTACYDVKLITCPESMSNYGAGVGGGYAVDE
jgi:hypothetical protein